jgi:hypothetical protein
VRRPRAGNYLSLFFSVLIIGLLVQCGVKTGLKPESDLNPSNIQMAHYIHEDPLLTLAAHIRPSDPVGSYEFEFLIHNKSKTPLPMNYYRDILTLSYEGKNFSVRKQTKLKDYPESLEPGESALVIFNIDGIFSSSVYEIDKLTFKLGEKRHTLKRNPGALCQNRDSLL